MNNFYILTPFFLLLLLINSSTSDTTVLMTEVFALPIDPPMFNWTYEDADDQYIYRPSLVNKPDLPSWIHYKYSKRHRSGFLYGVPQKHYSGTELEIIALNRLNYETRRHSFFIHVTEKLNPARHEVQLKIDNLNVEDMFDIHRMERLKDVFRKKLWRESEEDLYVTFLESAVQLGARLPLRPNEGEGVVIRLGSRADFSSELLKLQVEVRPLWKLQSCPRDFKRTKVERLFREAGFAMDWCSFRLLEDDGSAMHHSSHENGEASGRMLESGAARWISVAKGDIPSRNYSSEFIYTIIVPVLVMIVLVWILSLILCFHHEGINDEKSEKFFDSLFDLCIDYYQRSKRNQQTSPVQMAQYANIQRATNTLRNLSASNKDVQYSLATDTVRSRTNSPSGTLSRTYCRPSPPPYPSASKQEFGVVKSPERTWFC